MADVATPVITFVVNLSNTAGIGQLSPNAFQSDKSLVGSYDTNQANTRVTYFPGFLAGENRELKHGDTFQLAGTKATYYRKEIAKGNFSFLSVQSIDA